MITYLLKSAACLSLLLFFYHLVLEKEKMHTFNRFYLLIGVVASFLIPFATLTTVSYVEPITLNSQEILENPVINEPLITNIESPIDYYQIFIYFYLIISIILFIRFGMNMFKIIKKTRIYKRINHQNAILVLVDDEILPHTFWNYIFINKRDYLNNKIEEELFTHELTHVTQKHTLDVIILEILQLIFWVNPLFFFLKKAIQLNHEFLADETVINQHKNTYQYQHLLVNKAAWKNDYYLASNLNYSLTKKRLKMMTKQSSPTKILLKKLAVIPLLAGFVFLFAERVQAQEVIEIKEEPLETIVEEVSKEFQDKYDINYYEKLLKIYELKRNADPHFIKSSETRQKALSDLFSKLGSLYFKLSKEDKKKAKKPIHPHHPYARLMKNDVVFYKKRSELTAEDQLLIPPPPPNPNASKEEIKKAKEAYRKWEERTGNTFHKIPPPPKPLKELKPIKEKNKNYKFSIILEKNNEIITMSCKKGCDWKELNFNLKLNKPQIVNKYGLNKVNQRNSDDSFYFVLLQDKEVFDLKSTKNTKWKGLSGSSSEKMKLLMNQSTVKSTIK